jgi:hypothetical protein
MTKQDQARKLGDAIMELSAYLPEESQDRIQKALEELLEQRRANKITNDEVLTRLHPDNMLTDEEKDYLRKMGDIQTLVLIGNEGGES